jgi:hydrogenase nickel incorporation protein HypA/HybF
MHEMSIAESILDIVETAAREQGAVRVKEVRLEIGALSGVEVEALTFCLDVVLKNSVADGARVELERLPGLGWCMQCGVSVPIAALYDPCPKCGSFQVQPTGGMDMRVKDLLVE